MTPELDAILREHLGLAVPSIGPRAVEAAVRQRMAATRSGTPEAYAKALAADPAERERLAEAVAVPETWFFRYPESFRELARLARESRPRPTAARPFRLLCVPCSTGEEAYSAAITLHDAGLAGLYQVEAYDVSARAVEFARAASYGANSFREADPPARHLEASRGRHLVAPPVRQAVRFGVGNVVAPGFLAVGPRYDAVFCRNLFIYLTDEARRAALALFDRVLAPGGRLFFGHAEPLAHFDARFQAVGPAQAFTFRRHVTVPTPAVTPAPTLMLPAAPSPLALPATPVPSPPIPVTPVDPLASAHRAIDAGRADVAITELEAVLPGAPTPAGYTLLGVALTILGRMAPAEAAFQRALYLDPRHFDALVHLLAAAENRGDAPAAANYRRRAAAAGKVAPTGGRP